MSSPDKERMSHSKHLHEHRQGSEGSQNMFCGIISLCDRIQVPTERYDIRVQHRSHGLRCWVLNSSSLTYELLKFFALQLLIYKIELWKYPALSVVGMITQIDTWRELRIVMVHSRCFIMIRFTIHNSQVSFGAAHLFLSPFNPSTPCPRNSL